MSTWKRILTEDDGTLATSDQTIESGESREVTLANNTTFTLKSSNVDGSFDGGALVQIFDSVSGGTQDILTLQANQTKLRVTGASNSVSGSLSFKEADDNGSHMITLAAPSSVVSNLTFTLPGTDGSNGHVLTTDGSGNLSFAAASGGGSIDGSGATNKLAYWSDSDTLTSDTLFGVTPSTGNLQVGSITASTAGAGTGTGVFEITTSNHDMIGVSTTQTVGSTSTGARFFSKFGTGTVTAGKVYHKTSSNTWALAANDDLTEASSLLAVADHSASSQIMLKEGAVKMASNQGFSSASRGAPLYLSPQGGSVTATAPTAGNSAVYVRIIGYVIDPSNSIIYFDPDKSWLEI